MSFCIALAVRDMGMTVEEALLAATARRRPGAAPRRTSAASRPGRRADAVVLDAPSPAHLVYRPGVPLVAATLLAGRVAYRDASLWP